jgi:hypothetical protein
VKAQHDKKLQQAIALKDYAIENNFFVPDDIIAALNKADYSDGDRGKAAESTINLDKAIRDLTRITYPTTVETIQVTDGLTESPRVRRTPRCWILFVALTLVGAIVSYSAVSAASPARPEEMVLPLAQSALAAFLGLMGTLVYILFNLIGIISEKAFNSRDTCVNGLRIVLGPVLGWVLFFGLTTAFPQITDPQQVPSSSPLDETSERWAVVLVPL